MSEPVYAMVRCGGYTMDGKRCNRTSRIPVSPDTRRASLTWRCVHHMLRESFYGEAHRG